MKTWKFCQIQANFHLLDKIRADQTASSYKPAYDERHYSCAGSEDEEDEEDEEVSTGFKRFASTSLAL